VDGQEDRTLTHMLYEWGGGVAKIDAPPECYMVVRKIELPLTYCVDMQEDKRRHLHAVGKKERDFEILLQDR